MNIMCLPIWWTEEDTIFVIPAKNASESNYDEKNQANENWGTFCILTVLYSSKISRWWKTNKDWRTVPTKSD